MTPEMFNRLKTSLTAHEGRRNFLYRDTMNNETIGIGYNISARGLPDKWIDDQFQEDAYFFATQLSKTFPWFNELNDDRQIILIDMAYNLGWIKFLTFEKMLNSVANSDYEDAGKEMLDSEWAKQVKTRAIDLSDGMITGKYKY